MEKFTSHRGIVAPLLRSNVDTDTIIPSREMKLVSKRGLSEGLFAGWRYTSPENRETNTDFVLCRDEYSNTSIIVSGSNFGCGSSREHAVWALKEYGIRVIIASSFGSIFYKNCIHNGILPIVLADKNLLEITNYTEKNPQSNQLTVDLPQQLISTDSGKTLYFELNEAYKEMLTLGLDNIDLTLRSADKINQFEKYDRQQRPWIYL